ncbi:hypothetical protein I4U23_021628 [Adineta vaga]|nr:hypothetical protein I4U23_021628 [Adineta vaga]
MCCCHCSCLYRNLPFFHGLTGFLEMILGIIRIAIFFSSPTTQTNVSRKEYTTRYVAAFIIDWISSGIPTLVGIFTALIILLIILKFCYLFLKHCVCKDNNNNHSNTRFIRRLIANHGIRRFLIFDCNCSCYKARPKLRFQVRFILLFTFFILRITAIGLYATSSTIDLDGGAIAIICALSLIFIFNTLCLDFYRYWVWWHYTPKRDTKCSFTSKKHERYLPYHMVGDYRDARTLGDRPCTDKPCHKRTLDHIAVFHCNDYQPQQRWSKIEKPPLGDPPKSRIPCKKSDEFDNQPHYIGFHTTDPDAAISIAHSEFRPGTCGWIGAGVYFARSIVGTIGKAKSDGGAYIIAEIRMGKVYEVERDVITKGHEKFNPEIYDFAHHSKWQEKFDTCYMLQNPESRDEFVIKDAKKQIVKWVMVIDERFDPKVERYGLLTEFDSTECGCI